MQRVKAWGITIYLFKIISWYIHWQLFHSVIFLFTAWLMFDWSGENQIVAGVLVEAWPDFPHLPPWVGLGGPLFSRWERRPPHPTLLEGKCDTLYIMSILKLDMDRMIEVRRSVEGLQLRWSCFTISSQKKINGKLNGSTPYVYARTARQEL